MPIDERQLGDWMGEGWTLSVPPVCPACGYNLTGLDEPRCPECGGRYTWKELRQQALERQSEMAEQTASAGDVRTAFIFAGAGLGLWGLGWLTSGSPLRIMGVLAQIMSFVLGFIGMLLGVRLLYLARVKLPEGFEGGAPPNLLLAVLAMLAGLAVCALALAVW